MIKTFATVIACFIANCSIAQSLQYTITLLPGRVHVAIANTNAQVFKMPRWTPGYYQFISFPEKVSNFKAGKNTIEYDVKADSDFVAAAYADNERALLNLTGICMHPENIKQAVQLKVITPEGWSVATGMDKKGAYFTAPDFDILYDSPLLCGRLDSLPTFTVKGIPHYFVGLGFADFDRQAFINDLQKIVSTAASIIGDIPYTHYTFLDYGKGQGGIEHLNSTTINFTGQGMDKQETKLRNYSFLAHEYFHHYNVKRIRPIELGPFDYEHGNKTKMLWVAEGLTVYYEYIIVHHAGLSTAQECLQQFRSSLMAYETKTGKLHQSLTESSWATWEEGPFGGDGISYYDKGPLIALLLDLQIRQATKNRKSLDDVMRGIYKKYYQQLQRGYTETEFRQMCEQIAGMQLTELFQYVSTTKEVDYNKYLAYAGLRLEPETYEFTRLEHYDTMQEKIYNSIF
ncbi:M61 family metallopeptidase [Chitinophaga sancti]|uniref:M61 family metallopeptidase n=1 Tax=Chitinophaga sancti TaxID=1004 RepID=A0A1K1R721_9BACT|nr:M61 family metallopeptidase [Chitinophaga sancti]WQD64189.1 M61 family metallopeptidase [Chitinophaga sancti]WQG90187.1 M61 family metallopeptidase [Chitinophaga sancti]SFW67627.1 Predicted metalloprotease, contains C-terminal PDZ domain [Chitinophaga sancti]